MYGSNPFESGDPPTPSPADGPVSPTGTVLEAVECDTARYVALAPVASDAHRTYLILNRTDAEEGMPLSYGDVNETPELQNALAHFGPRAESVRVLTHPGRRRQLETRLEQLDEYGSHEFQYGGEGFQLSVRVG